MPLVPAANFALGCTAWCLVESQKNTWLNFHSTTAALLLKTFFAGARCCLQYLLFMSAHQDMSQDASVAVARLTPALRCCMLLLVATDLAPACNILGIVH